jgi:RecA-family ATPase
MAWGNGGGEVTRGPWQKKQRLEEFAPFSPARWQGSQTPGYRWMVDGCFLQGTVALVTGDGGLGKSLLMQQLCTAAALGRPWLGLTTRPTKTFFFGCEDDADELHRRQAAICEHYGCEMGDLGDMLMIDRPGKENALVEFDRRTDWGQPTQLYNQAIHTIKEHGAQIVVFDTVADVFSGNEIIRNQVRRFITILRKLALEIQGAVIITAHPSNEGLASGSGLSGNRAWSNSVRSRLFLSKDGKKDDDGDRNVRWLRTMKNNQGPYGNKLKLRWSRGVFAIDEPPPYKDFTEAMNDATF